MRIGLMIGSDTDRQRAERLTGLVDDARAAEEQGFVSMWIPQIPGYIDAMTAISLMGHGTERIELGTAVVPVQTRHPITMAQQALTTEVACRGRFTLGLGASHHWIVEDQMGLEYDRPARLVRDYLQVMNAALAGPGRDRCGERALSCAQSLRRGRRHTDAHPRCCPCPGDAADRRRVRVGNHPLDGGRAGHRRSRRPPHHQGRRRRRTTIPEDRRRGTDHAVRQ